MARIKSPEMLGFIKPQLATLKAKAPNGDQWLHEIKFDGYRVQIHLNKGKRKVFTRNGLDWTKRFSVIAGALDIPGQAIVDGEVVVINEGRTNFSELQADLAAGKQDRLVYYVFDLLWRDGDLRKLPQIERKQALSGAARSWAPRSTRAMPEKRHRRPPVRLIAPKPTRGLFAWKAMVARRNHPQRSANVFAAALAGLRLSAIVARPAQACRWTPSAGRAIRRSGSWKRLSNVGHAGRAVTRRPCA